MRWQADLMQRSVRGRVLNLVFTKIPGEKMAESASEESDKQQATLFSTLSKNIVPPISILGFITYSHTRHPIWLSRNKGSVPLPPFRHYFIAPNVRKNRCRSSIGKHSATAVVPCRFDRRAVAQSITNPGAPPCAPY